MLKVALFGYGRMGKLVDEIAPKLGIQVVARFEGEKTQFSTEALRRAEVAIDFSSPNSALKHIGYCADHGLPLVMGTTGWYDHLEAAEHLVESSGIGMIYAPNFSIGVHLFTLLVKKAAHLAAKVGIYDVAGLEMHHNEKGDSPSGTAILLADTIMNEMPEKKRALFNRKEGVIQPDELHFASLRCGHLPGTHTIFFDSTAETIELTHRSRNREAYAHGALRAAQWILNRKGFYSIDEMIEELLA